MRQYEGGTWNSCAMNQIHVNALFGRLVKLVGCGNVRPLDMLALPSLLPQVLTLVVAAAPSFDERAISNCLHGLAVLELAQEREVIGALLGAAESIGLAAFTPQGLANSAWALATLRVNPGPRLTAQLLQSSGAAMRKFKPVELAQLGWGLAVLRRARSLSMRETANVLWAMGRLGAAPNDPDVLRLLMKQLYYGMQDANGRDLASSLWALASIGHKPDKAWMGIFGAQAEALVHEFTPQEIANLLWAYAKLGMKPPHMLLVALWESVGGSSSSSSAAASSSLSPTSSTFGAFSAASGTGAAAADGFGGSGSSSSGGVTARLSAFKPGELAMLLWALASLQVVPGKLWWEQFLQASYHKMTSQSPQSLATIIWSLSELQLQPPPAWLYHWAAATRGALPQMSPIDLGQVAAALQGSTFEPLGLPKLETLLLDVLDRLAAVELQSGQFAPLFVWDHVAAVGMWAAIYIIEVFAILSVLKRYPDDAQKAARQARSRSSLSKRMLPIRLGLVKRTLYQLTTGSTPTTALSAAAPAAVKPSAQPLKFADSAVADVIADIEAQAAAGPRTPLGLPTLPQPGTTKQDKQQQGEGKDLQDKRQTPRGSGSSSGKGLQERRSGRGLLPGQWDPAAQEALVDRRSRELLQRKSYLRNFWYAAALSEKLLPGAPLGVDILGSRVVLFRDEADGQVYCLDDACPHRGAPLSQGWLATVTPDAADDASSQPSSSSSNTAAAGGHTCVVCPYHGWAFDGAGKLQDVPSAEPGRWPKRPLVNAYPVEERGGFIWLFWGDKRLPAEERPPIPFTPELEDPTWHAVYGEIEFECGHWGVFENAIDMAHIHYLHGDSFGNSEKPRIHDMTTTRDTFHVEAQFSIHNKPVSKMWDWTAVDSVPVTAKAMLPSSSAITIQLGGGVRMITFVNTVPISENRCVNRFALVRNFAGWEGFDGYARNAMFKILGEDKVMVEKLTPERLSHEFSLGPDAPQVAFRALRQEWIDMGYGVPPESVKPRRGLAPDM
ncbi:hypothetical protein OEZ85_005438 [Tetradesmus obliquus]|uniref:Rieske domain-containing protein n=1 Tax=Tetradesmus obliquus TaxID=3088 RepID=A0ABY8UND4_TETOB|nr:hypothetical protein OEZ85_005438 [Tetradesmus obliquus]